MGWLPRELDLIPLDRLELARQGRQEMVQTLLDAVFGKPKKGRRPVSRAPARGRDGRSVQLTPKLFDAMLGAGSRPERTSRQSSLEP